MLKIDEEMYTEVTDEDDDFMLNLKKNIGRLNDYDRKIILAYAELGSQRELAKELGFSVSKTNYVIRDIRKKIIDGIG